MLPESNGSVAWDASSILSCLWASPVLEQVGLYRTPEGWVSNSSHSMFPCAAVLTNYENKYGHMEMKNMIFQPYWLMSVEKIWGSQNVSKTFAWTYEIDPPFFVSSFIPNTYWPIFIWDSEGLNSITRSPPATKFCALEHSYSHTVGVIFWRVGGAS